MPASDELATDGRGGMWAGAWAHDMTRVPGRTTMWAVGVVSHTASSSTWDSLIAQYP
jgi:hypothetical protein